MYSKMMFIYSVQCDHVISIIAGMEHNVAPTGATRSLPTTVKMSYTVYLCSHFACF